MIIRLTLLMTLMLLITGCSGKSLNDFRVSAGFLSPYEAAVADFKQGDIMEARARLRSVAKDHQDYKRAQDFLKKSVEPARLKLLRFYAKKGKAEQKKKHWAQAEEAYKTAAALSIQPKALLNYQREMSEAVRRLRAETIYKQRKNADQIWLSWRKDYQAPTGLFADDEAFMSAREQVEQAYELRLRKTWALAEKYKEMDMPEMAWVYADSYLRLKSDSQKALDLKNAMATAIPKNYRLGEVSSKKKETRVTVFKASEKHVKMLMQQEKWAEAKREAQALRLQGNSKAEKLLKNIQESIIRIAEKAYADGNLAFRLEQIDKAVKFWEEAVYWMPKEQVYIDSLRRGRKIQERLSALKSDESPADKEEKVEE